MDIILNTTSGDSRRKRLEMAQCDRMECIHVFRTDRIRHPRYLPLPIRSLHPLSRRPHRKLLHGQKTGSRLPPITRRQTRNNRNHHRRHRKVCAHLGIRLVPVKVYLLVQSPVIIMQILMFILLLISLLQMATKPHRELSILEIRNPQLSDSLQEYFLIRHLIK